jgi:DNA polymerase (family 10)
MTNKEVATLLHHVAVSYAIKDEGKFRFQIIAYNKASEAIEAMTVPVESLFLEGRTEGIPGVGPSIREHLSELFTKGESSHFAKLIGELPAAMFPLLEIPSFGPKKAFKLVAHFDLKDPKTVIDDVEKLAKSDEIAKLEGFGKKSQDLILAAVDEYRLGKVKNVRMPLPFASELAEKIITYLKKCPDVIEAYPLGSLRRKRDTIGDVDIAVTTTNDEAVIEHFVKYPYVERILGKGKNEANFLTAGGFRVDLRTQPKESFGSLLQHFTGSKNHNVHLREFALSKGLSLSEWGIKKVGDDLGNLDKYETEEDFYNALGLAFIPPEIREDTGEIELAVKDTLPTLLETKDMKGDFHIHSSYDIEPSHDMGAHSMQEMLTRAKELHYEYLGFSEHNPSLSKHTKDEIVRIIEKRSKFIEQLKSNNTVRVFSLIETDILPDGKLALPDEALELLDGILVSIHSSFTMTSEEMTKRILKGLSHPKVKIFAHPTARLINQRPSINADWQEIFNYTAEHNTALEINAAPQRLDLPDELIRQAKKAGNVFFIDTDSHSLDGMDMMEYGVDVARRGWLEKKDVVNSWKYEDVKEWFEKI